MSHRKKHLLFLSFPAFGHIIPLLEFNRKLSNYHRITFAVSDDILSQMAKRGLINNYGLPNLKIIGVKDGYVYEDGSEILLASNLRAIVTMVSQGHQELIKSLSAISAKTTDSEERGKGLLNKG
jgi:hypothetical protein